MRRGQEQILEMAYGEMTEEEDSIDVMEDRLNEESAWEQAFELGVEQANAESNWDEDDSWDE